MTLVTFGLGGTSGQVVLLGFGAGEAPAGEVQPHGIIVISAEPRSVLIPSDAARVQIDAQPNRILISH